MIADNEPAATIIKKDESNTYILFGRDIAAIPCFRNSFLYGISGGIGGGLLTFLFTSRPKVSMHTAMAVYVNVTIGYWFYCRYTRFADKYKKMKLEAEIDEFLIYEDTDEQPSLKEKELINV